MLSGDGGTWVRTIKDYLCRVVTWQRYRRPFRPRIQRPNHWATKTRHETIWETSRKYRKYDEETVMGYVRDDSVQAITCVSFETVRSDHTWVGSILQAVICQRLAWLAGRPPARPATVRWGRRPGHWKSYVNCRHHHHNRLAVKVTSVVCPSSAGRDRRAHKLAVSWRIGQVHNWRSFGRTFRTVLHAVNYLCAPADKSRYSECDSRVTVVGGCRHCVSASGPSTIDRPSIFVGPDLDFVRLNQLHNFPTVAV